MNVGLASDPCGRDLRVVVKTGLIMPGDLGYNAALIESLSSYCLACFRS